MILVFSLSFFPCVALLVVIINEADSLSRDAQAALRRTMEKYMSNMRIILCANSTSKLIAPIKSRCLLMRVAAPNEEEVSDSISHYILLLVVEFDKLRWKLPFDMLQRRKGLTSQTKHGRLSLRMLEGISAKLSSFSKLSRCNREYMEASTPKYPPLICAPF